MTSLDPVTQAPAGPLIDFAGKVSPGNGYGLTETTSAVVANTGAMYFSHKDSVGKPVPVCDVKVTDPDGRELPPGEVGELWGRGPNIVKEYWRKTQASAETFVDGWVRTGDLARVDDEGFVFIIDRAKDMLIRGGENIYCVEVENALYDHPAVMDAAIVARPHHSLGEEPAAVVTLKPGAHASADELRATVAARLAAFKVPVEVRFWDGPLPRNANGKIVKSDLRKLFAEPAAA